MTPADVYATRLGARRIVAALTFLDLGPREVGRTAGGRSWISRCPAPSCVHRGACLNVTETALLTSIRCRGACRDGRHAMVFIHTALRRLGTTA